MIDDIMRARRSVRVFRPEPPPRDLLLRMVEAAITAPSASNQQPWRYLAITNRTVIRDLALAVREAVEVVVTHLKSSRKAAFREYSDSFTCFAEAPVVLAPLWKRSSLLSNLLDNSLPAEMRATIDRMEETTGLVGSSLALGHLLLMAHELGLGATCMTGPHLADDRIRAILEVPETWNLLALVPVGYPAETPGPTPRKPAERDLRFIE